MSEKSHEKMIFQIERIYTKDISFETPSSPNIFQQEWKPEVKLDLDTSFNKLGEHIYEVILCVTVTTTIAEKIAFLCEVKQGGIFSIDGIQQRQMSYFLCAYCPNILFPYVRECITNLVSRGTFPQLNLAPINFDALFMKYEEKYLNKIEVLVNHQGI